MWSERVIVGSRMFWQPGFGGSGFGVARRSRDLNADTPRTRAGTTRNGLWCLFWWAWSQCPVLSAVLEDVSTKEWAWAEEHQESNFDGGSAQIAQQLVAVYRAEARCSLELDYHLIRDEKICTEISNANSAARNP
jgi:hypothetical protein